MPGRRNTLTELQAQVLAEMRAAGAVAVVLTSMKQLDYVLDAIDTAMEWPVTNLGVRNQLDRIGREARERREHGYHPREGTLEQRFARERAAREKARA